VKKNNLIAMVIFVSAGAAGACGLVFDTDALQRGSPSVASDGGATETGIEGDAGDDSGPTCPSPLGRGPKMIDADGKCIDATEVSVADYDLFQKQTPSPLLFDEPCKFVTTLRPTTFDEQLKTPTRPVVNVNYCHAFHYCKWAGKHLCGHVDGGGALQPGDAGMNVSENEWLRACTRVGKQRYSYGTTVSEGACTTNSFKIVPVGTRDACKGPYPGLFDMLGNVGEWIDACTNDGVTPDRDGCMALGVEDVIGAASCWDGDELSRYWTAPNLGFRCCGN
jgi:formylglycine-generating enzyme required for sulfatase activity